jgi:hypothetical protein
MMPNQFPRSSVRERKPVNYHTMVAGTGEVSASMDYGEVSGSNARVLSKTKSGSKDSKMGMEEIFQLLRGHQSIQLFLEPLNPNHPKFNDVRGDFINLTNIELNFRSNKYQSPLQLANDFRKMWNIGFKLYANEPEKYSQVIEIQQYFEQIFPEFESRQILQGYSHGDLSNASSSKFPKKVGAKISQTQNELKDLKKQHD